METVTARCASCHSKGINRFRVVDERGKTSWIEDPAYALIAISQRSPDAPSSTDPFSHIPYVVSCGSH